MAGAAGPGELHRQWQSRGFNEQAHNLLRAKCWEHGFGIERKNYQRARVRAQEAHLLILITHWPISYFCLCIYIYIIIYQYACLYWIHITCLAFAMCVALWTIYYFIPVLIRLICFYLFLLFSFYFIYLLFHMYYLFRSFCF